MNEWVGLASAKKAQNVIFGTKYDEHSSKRTGKRIDEGKLVGQEKRLSEHILLSGFLFAASLSGMLRN